MTSRLKWSSAQAGPEHVDRLADTLSLPRPVAAVLVGRGLHDPDDARDFLTPRLSRLSDPFEIAGMPAAADRVLAAIDAGEPITVFGDYDADGVTATALLVTVLRSLGARVTPFTPCRRRDGYGLTASAAVRCLDEQSPRVLLTVDCGTNSQATAREVRRLGVDVVVTDHHEVGSEGTATDAVAVVNPKLGAPEAARDLCGVGVAFKLCHALLKRRLAAGREVDVRDIDLRDQLGLVALGTVCDMVPLTGENRAMVRYGLRRLEEAGTPGIAALRNVSGANGALSCYHLGFLLGPRLNAAGRLGQAAPALELLLTSDPDRAWELARELDRANHERQRIEQVILEEALLELAPVFDAEQHFGLVVGRPGWDVGVVGIVASRLCRHYGRPAAVVAFEEDGAGKGSCRGVEGVDLVEVLQSCDEHLDTYGGHQAAAGIGLASARLAAFRDAFNAQCASRLAGRDLRPVQVVDAWLDHLGEADDRLLEGIDRLRPLGCGNPSPVWGVRHVTPVGPPRRVGRDGAHLKMVVAGGGTQIDTIGFGMGNMTVPDGPMDLLFEFERNEFRGSVTRQLKLCDLRPSEKGDHDG